MLRTRDFAVLFGIIAFLLVGITATWRGVVTLPFSSGVQGAALFTAVEGEPTYSAVVPTVDDPAYESRRAQLAEKIAKRGNLATLDEQTADTVSEVPPVPAATDPATMEENRCSSYRTFAGTWVPAGVKFEEVEGARLVYKETAAPVAASGTVPALPTRTIIAQLPVRSVPLAQQSCISMDVIGIATDGSLIRNHEVALYGIFGSDTLVGYALDGFPIYGGSAASSDICGGMMVGGQYRYYVDSKKEVILTCYAGAPITL